MGSAIWENETFEELVWLLHQELEDELKKRKEPDLLCMCIRCLDEKLQFEDVECCEFTLVDENDMRNIEEDEIVLQ